MSDLILLIGSTCLIGISFKTAALIGRLPNTRHNAGEFMGLFAIACACGSGAVALGYLAGVTQ